MMLNLPPLTPRIEADLELSGPHFHGRYRVSLIGQTLFYLVKGKEQGWIELKNAIICPIMYGQGHAQIIRILVPKGPMEIDMYNLMFDDRGEYEEWNRMLEELQRRLRTVSFRGEGYLEYSPLPTPSLFGGGKPHWERFWFRCQQIRLVKYPFEEAVLEPPLDAITILRSQIADWGHDKSLVLVISEPGYMGRRWLLRCPDFEEYKRWKSTLTTMSRTGQLPASIQPDLSSATGHKTPRKQRDDDSYYNGNDDNYDDRRSRKSEDRKSADSRRTEREDWDRYSRKSKDSRDSRRRHDDDDAYDNKYRSTRNDDDDDSYYYDRRHTTSSSNNNNLQHNRSYEGDGRRKGRYDDDDDDRASRRSSRSNRHTYESSEDDRDDRKSLKRPLNEPKKYQSPTRRAISPTKTPLNYSSSRDNRNRSVTSPDRHWALGPSRPSLLKDLINSVQDVTTDTSTME